MSIEDILTPIVPLPSAGRVDAVAEVLGILTGAVFERGPHLDVPSVVEIKDRIFIHYPEGWDEPKEKLLSLYGVEEKITDAILIEESPVELQLSILRKRGNDVSIIGYSPKGGKGYENLLEEYRFVVNNKNGFLGYKDGKYYGKHFTFTLSKVGSLHIAEYTGRISLSALRPLVYSLFHPEIPRGVFFARESFDEVPEFIYKVLKRTSTGYLVPVAVELGDGSIYVTELMAGVMDFTLKGNKIFCKRLPITEEVLKSIGGRVLRSVGSLYEAYSLFIDSRGGKLIAVPDGTMVEVFEIAEVRWV